MAARGRSGVRVWRKPDGAEWGPPGPRSPCGWAGPGFPEEGGEEEAPAGDGGSDEGFGVTLWGRRLGVQVV